MTSSWNAIKERLGEEFEEYSNPFYDYEDCEAADEILNICESLEEIKNISSLPSVQAGRGIMEFFSISSDTIFGEVDYLDYCDMIADMAFASNSADEFKDQYSQWLKTDILNK